MLINGASDNNTTPPQIKGITLWANLKYSFDEVKPKQWPDKLCLVWPKGQVSWPTCLGCNWHHSDGLMQKKCNSIANKVQFHLSCINPSISCFAEGQGVISLTIFHCKLNFMDIQFCFQILMNWIHNFGMWHVLQLHLQMHDDVIKWKHFPRNWPFVWGIHRSRWIPPTKASDAELWCFLWCASE